MFWTYWHLISWATVMTQLAFVVTTMLLVGGLMIVPTTRNAFNRCYDTSLRVFQFPAYMFDLLDAKGRPDHGKIVPFIVVMTWNFGLVVNMLLTRSWPPVVLVIGVMSLSFLSANVFRWFLKRSQFKATDEHKEVHQRTEIDKKVQVTVIEARDPGTGEPGPTDPLQAPKDRP